MELPSNSTTFPQQQGHRHQLPSSSSNKPWLKPKLKSKPKPKLSQLFKEYQLKPKRSQTKPKLKIKYQPRTEELWDIRPA